MITGKVTTIDYQRNVFGVDAGSRGRFDVWVMPTTSIQGKDSAYHTFTDLNRGMRVQDPLEHCGREVRRANHQDSLTRF